MDAAFRIFGNISYRLRGKLIVLSYRVEEEKSSIIMS
jgi:hypothetical protein